MASKQRERVEAVIAILERQCSKLRDIQSAYRTDFDAAFDAHGARTTLERWFDRTYKLIQDRIGDDEASKFKRSFSAAPGGRGAWHWIQLCHYFHTYVVRLIEDIKENPEDPSFNLLDNLVSPSQKAASEAQSKYDIFLSYSTIDKDEARAIYDAISKVGKTSFLAIKNLKPGDKFRDEIRDALKASSEIWILVSPNSIKSDWVSREAAAAWVLGKRIVPILLRCSANDLPDEVADTQAIDYHNMNKYITDLGRRRKPT